MENISFQDIMRGFAEIQKMQKETAESFKETQAEIKALGAAQKETDEKFKETDARLNKQSAEINKQLEKLGQQIGGLGEKFGSFTEGLAYPSLRKILFEKYKIDNTVANYLRRLPNGNNIELDAFGFSNGVVNNAAVVEVKSHLQSKHIYKFVDKLKSFRDNFPEFANKHLYGILCTVSIVSTELQQEVFANGLHLAYIHDDMFDLQMNANATDFNA